ncbi:hypothetical protein [Streptomyces sp. NPDC053560]|uniref:hypothetical protein n=1 Tax=Streptomyces sp. NPDC053560 TaxID=3365711 RepID=UPI0037CDBA72
MIRVITTGRLQALEADRAKLAQALDAADIAQAEQQEAQEDLERVRKVADDLMKEVATLSVAALRERWAYVLFHRTQIHGIYTTLEAAEAAAEQQGAAPSGWVDTPADAPKGGSPETLWRIIGMPVQPEDGDAG